MKVLYLITARGGSKGIPGKNIKLLKGKPLIQYSVDLAKALAKDIDICVSTDSIEIKEVVENLGLEVPFLRPDELAQDTSGSLEVILHALNHYAEKGVEYDWVVLLQPTSPFRTAEQVKKSLELKNDKVEMIVSVKESEANPYYNLFEEDDLGFLTQSKPGNFLRRQDCPKVYEQNGAIYVINIESLLKQRTMNFKKIIKFVMDKYSSLDIDTPSDWEYCEYLLKENKIKL